MVQTPSEHDDDNLVNDFAPEHQAAPSKPADLESVVLWLADSWRESKRFGSSVAGILILLATAAVAWVWWGIQPATPSEEVPEVIASSRLERQPIEPPVIVPSVSLSSQLELVLPDPVPVTPIAVTPIESDAEPVEKRPSAPPRPASGTSVASQTTERPSPPAPVVVNTPQVSPPMPAPVSAPKPSPPVEIREEEPVPVRTAAVEPPPPPPPASKVASKSPGGFTTWATSKSGIEDPESVAIQDVLGRYRSAFGALDVAGVRQVWPSVNQRSLERAFRQLEGQEVSFFSCTIDVSGARADASCVGTTNFIPKVGNRTPQSGPSQWNFKLSKRSADGWLIDDALAR